MKGKLVRMIEGSTENVRTDSKDTVRLLLLLLVFAVTASSYVLREGMKESNKRSKYQLLIHCILIVTSVIPPELPMQMALAVNTSLMALMKMQVKRLAVEQDHLMSYPLFSFSFDHFRTRTLTPPSPPPRFSV